MTNPLPPNAVLTFDMIDGTTIDANGNVIPAVPTEIAVLAYLKLNSRRMAKDAPGVDPDALYLTGYAVDPPNLAALAIPNRMQCDMGGTLGTFELEAMANPPYGRGSYGSGLAGIGVLIEGILGTKLEGWFTANKT